MEAGRNGKTLVAVVRSGVLDLIIWGISSVFYIVFSNRKEITLGGVCYHSPRCFRANPAVPAALWMDFFAPTGLDALALRRMKELEEENRRLKQMYAELSLDHQVLKDIVEKKL